MLKYIIRLDDACENMNEQKWNKIENILDKYNIKPIVGIIPENKDEEFKYGNIKNFWTKYAKRWQEKGWIIAQHGLNHNLSKKIRTEFSGKSKKEQKRILEKGLAIMKKNNIKPDCFFAPAHTFDDNTIDSIKEIGEYKFISDGYAFYPYRYRNVVFFPSVFDTPHKISPFGVFTFVYHPNNMNEEDYKKLEVFLKKYHKNFDLNINEILEKYSNRKRNVVDKLLHNLINIFRKLRNKNE